VPRAEDLEAAVAAADLVTLLQSHQAYDLARIAGAADARHPRVVPAAPHVETLCSRLCPVSPPAGPHRERALPARGRTSWLRY